MGSDSSTRVATMLLACACASACIAPPARAQTLRAGPDGSVLEGDPVALIAEGLAPAELVTLRAERWFAPVSATPKPPRLFRSEARFRADARGVVDVARVAPVDGSYSGVDARVRRVYERGRAAYPARAAKARIPVEKIRGDVMVIGAYDDQMWPSGMMAQNLAERRLEANLRVTARLYPDAGHLLYQTGYEPTTQYHRRAQKPGGSPAADARAQADAWQATWEFLEQALRRRSGA